MRSGDLDIWWGNFFITICAFWDQAIKEKELATCGSNMDGYSNSK